MAEARIIEMMARAIYDAELAAERRGPVSDATWASVWSVPLNMIRRHYDALARAALSVLAANVSEEMVAKIICSAIWKTPAMVEKMWPVFLPAAREVIDTLTTPGGG